LNEIEEFLDYRKKLQVYLSNRQNELNKKYLHKIVEITKGKYSGYQAKIESIDIHKDMSSSYNILFLCMVYSKNGKYFLNSDTETRMYRDYSQFKFLEKEENDTN
jgi:hypothetical protein